MENLTLKISREELPEITIVVKAFLRITPAIIIPDKYFHFYNLRALAKKLLQKNISLVGSFRRSLTLKININEYEAFRFYAERSHERINFDPYYLTFTQNILTVLQAQREGLSHPSNFVLP